MRSVSFQKFRFLLMVLMVFSFLTVSAQKKDLAYYRCAFFESYRQGNMSPWPGLIAEMENARSTDLDWQIETVKAMYGFVGYQLSLNRKDQTRVFVDKADRILEKLLNDYPRNAQLHSLLGAFCGYKITLAFYKAPFLGPQTLSHIKKAIELDPTEPMGYIEKGNSLLYRPAALGGDKGEALSFYRKAQKLMESGEVQACSWQYMLLRAFILKCLYETNRNAEANVVLEAMRKDYGSLIWIHTFVDANLMEGK